MNRRYLIIVILLVTALLAIAGYFYYLYVYKNESQFTENKIDNSIPTNNEVANSADKLTLIYREEISLVMTQSRAWPTVRLTRQVIGGPAETLATVGKQGEYPNGFVLSTDRKFVYINLESKLMKLDLATKRLTQVLVPKKQISSFVLSPDGTKAFVWDQIYASDDQQHYVHIVDLQNLQDKIIYQGDKINTRGFFFAQKWRTDNKVILLEGLGEFGVTWYYDLNTNAYTLTPDGPTFGVLSGSGQSMAVTKLSIGDICNDFSGDAISTYDILDPVSGNILNKNVGQKNKITGIVTFSPDDKQVLYAVNEPVKEKADCDKPVTKTYHLHDLVTGRMSQVSNTLELLKQWNEVDTGVEYFYDHNAQTQILKLQDQVLLGPISTNLQLISAYYQ